MASSSRIGLLLVALDLLSNSVSAVKLEGLLRREATTDAVCSPDFIWANNAQGKTPCRLAAEVIAPCHGGNWRIQALVEDNLIYDRPGEKDPTTLEDCTCSWAAYNLISACAACQGKVQAIRPWTYYITHCPETTLTEDNYYPPGQTLADGTSLPFWATTNPLEWIGRSWNLQQARSIHDQGRADVVPGTIEKKKSSAGPIAGGVVGGLVVVIGAAALVFFLLKRHRRKLAIAKGIVPVDHLNGHMRSPSDATDKSGISASYTNLTSTPGFPTGYTPTIRTHESSNYQYSAFGVPERVSMPVTMANNGFLVPTTPSPPPNAHSRQMSLNREEVITPFNLTSPSPDAVVQDVKGHMHVPSYDSPNAPPARIGDALFETPRRGRVNPPAYSPSPPPHESVSVRGGPSHVRSNPSVTSHRTQTSISSQPHVHVHSGGSDIETTPPDAMSGVPDGTTIGTDVGGMSYPRDVKRRPTEDSVTTRDLA